MPSRSGYSSVDSSPSASESVQSSSLSYRRIVIPVLGLLTFAAGLVAFKAADGADLPVLGRHKRGFELLGEGGGERRIEPVNMGRVAVRGFG